MLRRLLRSASLLALAGSLLLTTPAATLAAREPYRAASPEYGLSVFLHQQPATTARDLAQVQALGFGWVKTLFRWTDIEHDYLGTTLRFPGAPVKLSETPWRLDRPAPLPGQDNAAVYGDLLGLSAGEIATLNEQGTL